MNQKFVKNIKSKVSEIKDIQKFNSKHPRFKSWHASTLSLLKNLPPEKTKILNEFKKLTFEDTKYHRGKNVFEPAFEKKFVDDLNKAKRLLSRLIPKKNAGKNKATSN